MSVLVLGATGNIGSHLTKFLLERNVETRVLVRDVQKAKQLFGESALLTYVEGKFIFSSSLRF